jgi:hypothetical protein
MISHFSAVLLFTLFVSVDFGITQRTQPEKMVRFGLFCFACMVGACIVISWLMFFIKH